MSTPNTPHDATKRPLPEGWRWVRLGEVCEFVRGVSFDKSEALLTPENGFVPILRAGNIQGLLELDRDLVWVPSKNVSREQFLQVGDIAICMSSGSPEVVGKTAQLHHYWYGSVGAFCGIIRPSKSIVPDWLGHWFRSSQFIQWRDNQARGANIQNLRFSQIQEIEIPLPPLSEQQRIAAILREQMAAAERARRAAEEQLEAAKALPAAFLRQVFPRPGEPLPAGWRWVKLGEVCKQERTIVEPNSTLAEELPYLSLEHIESNTGRILKNATEKMEDEGKSTTFFFDNRHVLYGKLRPYLNKVALPDFTGRCTTEMIPLLPSADADREFLCWVLRRQETVDAAMRGKTGSRMPRADMDELLNLEIPLPPLAEQQRIAAILREQMAAAERARQAIEAQLEAINKLPAAILRKAFNGAL